METTTEVHLLDVGTREYGDAVLCRMGNLTILIDGGHPGDWNARAGYSPIQDQLTSILGGVRPASIDLLVVSHAHSDHIGCLPELVTNGLIAVRWAYVPPVPLAWPAQAEAAALDVESAMVLAGLREEDLRSFDDDDLETALIEAHELRERYTAMLSVLASTATVVYHGDATNELIQEFAPVCLNILGPSRLHLELAHQRMTRARIALEPAVSASEADVGDPVARYRALADGDVGLLEAVKRAGAAVNAQSAVMSLGPPERRLLFAGDMQFADPESGAELGALTSALWQDVLDAGPFAFVKLSHHGSENANPHGFIEDLGRPAVGICAGSGSDDHPSRRVLHELQSGSAQWVRTDINGHSTVIFAGGSVRLHVDRGSINDPEPASQRD